KKILEKFVLFLHKKYSITPDVLSYIRIFSAPWFALLVSKILSSKSLTLTLITIILYTLIVATDLLDGILARAISKTENYDHLYGSMLDRIADKILIIFMLIPFGLNLFTFLIISAESILAFQVLYSPSHKKQATRAGKIKMVLQAFLIPILILKVVTNFIPEMVIFIYMIITIILTYISVYSHYFYFKND
ncbi:MAG: CDP-alcohol phosphatidyltransferase family protein, partial [Patescibacteria group bacterium]